MAKFHINPNTGHPGKCTAEEGNCPFGEDAPHFASASDARKSFESSMANHPAGKGLQKRAPIHRVNENLVPKDYEDIAAAFKEAWGADTSTDENWSPENPELGQCAVTALVVQDGYGGKLKRGLANGVSHYWNEINGEVIDLTRAQFLEPIEITDESERERDYVLSYPATVARYNILKERIRI